MALLAERQAAAEAQESFAPVGPETRAVWDLLLVARTRLLNSTAQEDCAVVQVQVDALLEV